MKAADLPQRVDAVRRFNRFYTKRMGILNAGFLNSPFSLSEVRLLYELAQRNQTATELSRELSMDPGQLSRSLSKLAKHGLIHRNRSAVDGRQHHLRLTDHGRDALGQLAKRQASQVEALLTAMPASDQERLVKAMRAVEQLLSPSSAEAVPYILRRPRPGDMGWVVQAHGQVYAEEYGWDERFEGLVASIVSDFVTHGDSRRECCWIAERDGENVGSVFLVKHSDTVAKLRLFLVSPKARGLGIGKRLVEECVRFARQTGYRKITLWTVNVLGAARHLYSRAGFQLVHEAPHAGFGHELIDETWELSLGWTRRT